MENIIIPAVVAIFASIATNLIAPLWQWRIEKKRKQLEYKQNLIKKWRDGIPYYDGGGTSLITSSVYASIRPYLSIEARSSIESDRIAMVQGQMRQPFPYIIALDEISRIEKEWELL